MHIDEAARLEAVRRYAILDTPPDGAFDRIAAIAARILSAPVALVASSTKTVFGSKPVTASTSHRSTEHPGYVHRLFLMTGHGLWRMPPLMFAR